ncbi:hypothetical protein EG68_07021 [Paragonimus skrjabini miyazakii]|uniref:Uncharacterized protein n=1 Tax=Paragonimus skrjabini miyazakii TaxID=59628 RepID=A0A8S9YVK3_9TREM|nr:hypothetical protein EG68_07021 [Paragonimus skrjabini miyazakii]
MADADLNSRTAKCESTLHLASRSGELKIAEILLNRGSDVNATDMEQRTPLFNATENEKVAQKLIEQTPIVAYERDEDRNYAVHLVAKYGFPQVLKKLIERAGQTHARNRFGWTPLTFSASFNQLDCVKLLSDEGAQVNTKDKFNNIPLFLACRGGHPDVVNKLLDAGADPGVRTIDTLKLRKSSFTGPTVSTILEDETENGQAGDRKTVHPVKLMVDQKARSLSIVKNTVGRSVHPQAKNDADKSQVGGNAKGFQLLNPQMMSTFSQASGPLSRLAVDEDLDEEPIHFG